MAQIDRVEHIIPVLKSILAEDVPMDEKHTFNKDVIDQVEDAVSKCANTEAVFEINNLLTILRKQGSIINVVSEMKSIKIFYLTRNQYNSKM